MKKTKNPLILVFAIIGVCAVLYGVWHLYNQQVAEERALLSSRPLHHPAFQTFSTMLPRRLSRRPGNPA